MDTFTLDHLSNAVARAAAIRLILPLKPATPGGKVFPPTHEGGQYAWETRRLDGRDIRCVLLDSVQSQANRMELALLAACRSGRLRLPLIEARFPEFSDIGSVTSLEAPHRIADAIFRDSTLDGVEFRDSPVGQAFVNSTIRNANGLYRYCPTALIYGVWDSTGSLGGLGNKFARAVNSEVIGINAVAGVHTSSRIDPLGIRGIEVYVTTDGDWTNDPAQAAGGPGKPRTSRPSEFNHSNIPPTLDRDERSGEAVRGGVTLDRAELAFVLSLPGLRRLRFPRQDGAAAPERDAAARTVLAALALCGIALQIEDGLDLRSRCLLIPDGAASYELIDATGSPQSLSINGDTAIGLLNDAVAAAAEADLAWETETVVLEPQERLLELVRRSRAAGVAEE